MITDPNRVKEIFLGAFEYTDEAERAAYLDRACGDDALLRKRIEALLRSHFTDDSFLDSPVINPLLASASATKELSAGTTEEDATHAAIALKFLQPSSRPDSQGRLGHYEVLQVLGRGGFGIVLRAYDEILQRVVAVKTLVPELAATSPARKRFLREARSSAKIRHENVVQVYAVEEQPLPYLVMEFVPGETLQQRLDRIGPLEPMEVVRIGRQIAEGLAASHCTGLIHRDIKPANILIEASAQDRVKITDFGLARAADDASMTQSGLLAGTPMFMAPEQARGETLDPRADLFSLGSVLYQMASGRPPFRAATTLAVLKRVAEESARPIKEIIPETPQWLCDIIAKLHAKKPDARFQSAREVADLLADCEAQLKANSKLISFARIPQASPWLQSPKINRVAVAGLMVFLVALIAGGIFGWNTFGSRNAQVTVETNHADIRLTLTGEVNGRDHELHQGDFDLPPGTYRALVRVGPDQRVDAISINEGSKSREVSESRFSLDLTDGGHVKVKICTLPRKADTLPLSQWATKEPLPPTFKNSIGMEFVIVPKGKSWLGGSKDKLGELEVELLSDFYLGKYEVTQEEWQHVMGDNPSHFANIGVGREEVKDIANADLKRFPVEMVSWDQCQEFVAKLNKLEQGTGWAYRLPRETEWEYACRGGPMTEKANSPFDYYFSQPTNTVFPNQANYHHPDALKRTSKVGSYEPNSLGLFDMYGNVWEWCEDLDHRNDTASRRGGCWRHPYRLGIASDRDAHPRSTTQGNDMGFRVARFRSAVPTRMVAHAALLKPFEMSSEGAATLKLQKDGSVLVLGEHPPRDRYTLLCQDLPFRIKAVRLEVLPNSNLPNNGPGRHPSGEFELTNVKAELESSKMQTGPRVLRLAKAWTDYNVGATADVQFAIDESERTGWKVRVDRPQFAVFELEEPVEVALDDVLRVTLAFQGDADHRQLGCFRLAAAADARAFAVGVGSQSRSIHETWIKAIGLLPLEQHAAALPAKLKEQLPEFDVAFLKAIVTMPADRQAIMVEAWQSERKPAFAGHEATWLKAIPTMQADAQANLVAAWLKERNPAFTGEVLHSVEGGVVISVDASSRLVQDLTPLRALSGLRKFTGRYGLGYDNKADNDAAVLRSLTKLETINGKPIVQFWKDIEVKQAEFKEWLKLVPALDANQQVEAVSSKLKDYNPGFTGIESHKIEEGVVTEIQVGCYAADLTPVRALPGLKGFTCNQLSLVDGRVLSDLSALRDLKHLTSLTLNFLPLKDLAQLKAMKLTSLSLSNTEVSDLTSIKDLPLTSLSIYMTHVTDLAHLREMNLTSLNLGRAGVTDLSPVKHMKLTQLDLHESNVSDLSPVKGMPLTKLNLYGTPVTELSPLLGMSLTELQCCKTKVSDLSPLQGMPLTKLHCQETQVSDLSALKGMALEEIRLTPKNITKGLDILRGMTSLKTIGIGSGETQYWPADQFWERFDKGEFK